ncbi:MAG: hypothetical protein J6P72_03020 [Firmicutes bacterium]|nr:hypothetical protein [Bacillota bacterium]
MAGIDRIKEAILSEAKAKVDTILNEANQTAIESTKAAEEEASLIRSEAQKKASQEAASGKSRIESQIGMLKRQTLLRARQEAIADVLEEAYQKLLNAPDEAYFDMLLKLAKKNMISGEGEMFLNQKDLQRLPKSFEEALAKEAAAKGGSIKVSSRPASLDSGFILRYAPAADESDQEDEPSAVPASQSAADSAYGTIELNCSLRSLFAEKKDQLSDLAYQLLF